jgi:phosphatidylglycerophosphatase A
MAQASFEPETAPRVSLRWMFAHPARVIALGFGSGLSRFAPGTCGTLFGWAAFVVLDRYLNDGLWAVVIAAMFAVGTWAAHATGRTLRQPDSGHIVIDEIVAIWIVLWLLPEGVSQPFLWQAGAFAVFRVFDIAKPPPIRALDARIKHGLGVMLDDLLAAFYTVAVLAVGVALTGFIGG